MSHNIDGNYVAEDTTKEIMILMGKELVGLMNSNHTIAHQHDNNMILQEKYEKNKDEIAKATRSCICALLSFNVNRNQSDKETKQKYFDQEMNRLERNKEEGLVLMKKRVTNKKTEQEAVIMYNTRAQTLFHYTIEICRENIHALTIVRQMKEEMKELKEQLQDILDTQEALQKNKKKSMWALRNSYTVEDLDL